MIMNVQELADMSILCYRLSPKELTGVHSNYHTTSHPSRSRVQHMTVLWDKKAPDRKLRKCTFQGLSRFMHQ